MLILATIQLLLCCILFVLSKKHLWYQGKSMIKKGQIIVKQVSMIKEFCYGEINNLNLLFSIRQTRI